MSALIWWQVVVTWFAVSLPIGMLVGHIIRERDRHN